MSRAWKRLLPPSPTCVGRAWDSIPAVLPQTRVSTNLQPEAVVLLPTAMGLCGLFFTQLSRVPSPFDLTQVSTVSAPPSWSPSCLPSIGCRDAMGIKVLGLGPHSLLCTQEAPAAILPHCPEASAPRLPQETQAQEWAQKATRADLISLVVSLGASSPGMPSGEEPSCTNARSV